MLQSANGLLCDGLLLCTIHVGNGVIWLHINVDAEAGQLNI